jgi:transposase
MSVDALLEANEALRNQLADRDSRIADLESKLELLAKKLKLTARERELLAKKLKQLAALRRRHPHLAPGQGLLEFDDDSDQGEVERPVHVAEAPDGETPEDSIRNRDKPRERTKKLDTSNLPVDHVHHELEPRERICPTTGMTLVPIGERLEEEIEYQPGILKRIVHHRAVYGLSEDDARERQAPELVAPGPIRPLPRSIVGPRLLAWILDQKYVRHLPLYRQEAILAQHGLKIPRQTMCDWVLLAASQLGPIQSALRRLILSAMVVQTDDTPVKCQRGKGHGHFLAHLWTTTSPLVEGLVFDFTESRGHEHLFTMFPGFNHGVLVGDGYAGYDAFAEKRPGVVVAGCWAHVLRKFRDALDEAPLMAVAAMTLIGKLFDIEKQADADKLELEARLALRQSESAAALEELERELKGWRAQYSESGKMGEACKYLENQRGHLRVFLDDSRVPIHNNDCELSIRPVAVGRRNWLFAGSVRGGQAAATIYSLVESCKRVGVDPIEYLADVLVRVATHPASRIEELIPANWKERFAPPEPATATA